jgi:hypothetical protein
MKNYTILTKKSVLDIQEEIGELDSQLQESALTNLWGEQSSLIKGEYFAIHFLEDKHFLDESYTTSFNIDDTIQCLAIKDGVDLVQFENGNMGFVAYYNGHKNGFEFKGITEKECYNLEDEEEIKQLFK